MADESLKMATLKKAYAEIILNTSKEAAARIMMADRRALSSEKELFALKEDALRMLVHLKQTLDSKIAEAEVRSANQESKIEELEAQLSEAEGIIVDLREELRYTQDKYEKMKHSQKQPLEQHKLEIYQDMKPISENELVEQTYDIGYQTVGCRDQTVRSAEEEPSTPFQLPMLSNCDASLDTYDGVKSARDRSSCSSESDEKDAKSTFNGSQAKLLEYENHIFQAMSDGFRRNRKNVKYQEAIAALRGCSRGRRAKSCQPPSFPQSKTFSGKQNEACTEPVQMLVNYGMCPISGSCCATSSCEINHNDETALERCNEFQDNSRCSEKDGDVTGKESNLSSNKDPLSLKPSLVDPSLQVQTPEETEVISSSNRADSEKVLKFTFHRKRRKEVLTKLDNNITPKLNSVLSRGLLDQGHPAKLQKTIVNDEHAKDSHQLMQVAHQLISLSENGNS